MIVFFPWSRTNGNASSGRGRTALLHFERMNRCLCWGGVAEVGKEDRERGENRAGNESSRAESKLGIAQA